MKVERKTAAPAFVPIVITLETEEEASHLWHKLNTSTPLGASYEFNWLLWHALDEVFHPPYIPTYIW